MKNLSAVKGSMTNILESNLVALNTAGSVIELKETIKRIFSENNLDTPASRRLIVNVGKQRNVGNALQVVYNSILMGCDLGVI